MIPNRYNWEKNLFRNIKKKKKEEAQKELNNILSNLDANLYDIRMTLDTMIIKNQKVYDSLRIIEKVKNLEKEIEDFLKK